MQKQAQEMGNRIRQAVNEIDQKAEVFLFASRARGEEQIDSDWDILVHTDYPIDIMNERIFRNHLYDLELETGEPLSIFVYSKSDWRTKQKATPFYQNVTSEGIVL